GELDGSGVVIRWEDAARGAVLAGGLPDGSGHYLFNVFDGITTGRFNVREVPPSGWTVTTPDPVLVAITKGDDFVTVDFGNVKHVRGGGSGGGSASAALPPASGWSGGPGGTARGGGGRGAGAGGSGSTGTPSGDDILGAAFGEMLTRGQGSSPVTTPPQGSAPAAAPGTSSGDSADRAKAPATP